jgi:hypothetical protein
MRFKPADTVPAKKLLRGYTLDSRGVLCHPSKPFLVVTRIPVRKDMVEIKGARWFTKMLVTADPLLQEWCTWFDAEQRRLNRAVASIEISVAAYWNDQIDKKVQQSFVVKM